MHLGLKKGFGRSFDAVLSNSRVGEATAPDRLGPANHLTLTSHA